MEKSKEISLSKTLSYILRHGAPKYNILVLKGGWIYIKDILEFINNRRGPKQEKYSLSDIYYVVKHNDKQRFSTRDNLIRANQGHSFNVDLELKERNPPDILYHGTHTKVQEKILEKGLLRMKRHHVHLTATLSTAEDVGKRRGVPIIFVINAHEMDNDGYVFYLSENNVWLTEKVPPKYLKLIE